mgnify:CR=1 FL=1
MPRFFCRPRLAALSRRALRAPAAGTKALKPWRRQGIWEAALALLCGNEIPFYYALAGDSMETVFPLTALSVGQQARIVRIEARGELARRIQEILAETGCEKVNIIAHSKGGLDSRAAIAHAGCAPFVATLTTINTPHRGCIFAEYLLGKVPEAARQKAASAYNAARWPCAAPRPPLPCAAKRRAPFWCARTDQGIATLQCCGGVNAASAVATQKVMGKDSSSSYG